LKLAASQFLFCTEFLKLETINTPNKTGTALKEILIVSWAGRKI